MIIKRIASSKYPPGLVHYTKLTQKLNLGLRRLELLSRFVRVLVISQLLYTISILNAFVVGSYNRESYIQKIPLDIETLKNLKIFISVWDSYEWSTFEKCIVEILLANAYRGIIHLALQLVSSMSSGRDFFWIRAKISWHQILVFNKPTVVTYFIQNVSMNQVITVKF